MCATLSINPVWITLGPIVVINAILFVSYMSYQLWFGRSLKREFAGSKKGGSHFLSSSTREWWFWTTDPIVNIFVKLKLGPNAITSMGFLFTCIAAVFFALGWFGYAGWIMIFGASFDMFDGRVARITGKSSRSGAFFDAVMDRFGEGVCLLGLAIYFRDSFMLPIVIIALIGSLLVSYTKARAEGIGVECNVGAMQRPERIVYLGVSSVFDPIMTEILKKYWAEPQPVLMYIALSLIAIMTVGTAIYRMVYVMNSLDTIDKRGKQSLPQLITRLTTPEGRESFWKKARYGYDRGRGPFSHAVLFLMGGTSLGLLQEIIKRGDLPNISAHIIERGKMGVATTAFPSTMGPTSAPFVTGAFPGTCDIPGTTWFNRSVPQTRKITINRFRDYRGWGAYVMDHDLSKAQRTIFEYSRQAVNIFGMLNRGCGLVRDPAFFRTYSRLHKTENEADLDDALETSLKWFRGAVRRETDFVLYSLPSMDFAGASQNEREMACHTFRKIDEHIGHAIEILKKNGMYDSTALMFSAAYGHEKTVGSFDLNSFLSKRHKLCTTTRGRSDWHNSDIIALASGTSMAHIYVRKNSDWSLRSFFEDIERKGLVGSLLEQNGTDILAGRSIEGGIVVQSRRGRAHIHEDADGRITYIIKGADPFGLLNVPQNMDSKSAFALCRNTAYPDGIAQVLQIFRSRRTGDLVLSAELSATITGEADPPPITHGSLGSTHMLVPFFSSVPADSSMIRTTDIFSLTLDLLGIEAAHPVDSAKS